MYESLQKFLRDSSGDQRLKQFLGLKRVKLFDEINQIVFFGKGGYTFETVYEMPVWLRKFTYKKLIEYYEKENESIEKAESGQLQSLTKPKNTRKPDLVIKRPGI